MFLCVCVSCFSLSNDAISNENNNGRDRVFKAAQLGCRRSRVRIQVESAGDLKIPWVLSSKWYLFQIREGYSSESWGMGSVFHMLCPRNRGLLNPH